MKKMFFTLMICCVSQILFAQSPGLPVSDSLKPIIQQQLLFQNRIMGKTDKGTIYALPQDNMPVLVPDSSITYYMPIKKGNATTQMPNPYYPYKQFIIQPKPGTNVKIVPTIPFKKRSDEKINLRKD